MSQSAPTSLHDLPPAEVPVIAVGPFFHGTAEDRARVAAEVASACETIGFLLVADHDVDEALIDDFYEVSKAFFRLPLEQKLRSKSPQGRLFQGYACPGSGPGYHTSERQSFNVNRFDTPADAVAAGYPDDIDVIIFDALWPSEPPRFESIWKRYMAEMEAFAGRLCRIFEAGLGLPDGWFADKVDHDPSTQVANYYSNDILSGHEPSPFRFKAHLDGDIFTILHQDDGPGSLQLHQRGLGWRNVRPIPGTFVVNIGELMARWTNDRFVATPHRVLAPLDLTETEPRMSAPFFLKPNLDAVIAPIPSLLAAGAAPKYPSVTGRQWLTKGQADIYAGYDSQVQFEELAAANPTLR